MPYVQLAQLVAKYILIPLAIGLAGWHFGASHVQDQWDAYIAKEQIESGKILQAATDTANAKALEGQKLLTDLETQHANHIQEIDQLELDNQRMLDAERMRHATAKSHSGTVPAAATATGSGARPASGEWLLSEESAQLAVRDSKRADDTTATAIACQDYARAVLNYIDGVNQ